MDPELEEYYDLLMGLMLLAIKGAVFKHPDSGEFVQLSERDQVGCERVMRLCQVVMRVPGVEKLDPATPHVQPAKPPATAYSTVGGWA